MSLPHFFLEEQIIAREDPAGFSLRLSPEDVHHLRVLRTGAGEHLAVIDHAQDYFEVEILGVEGEFPLVRVARHLESRPLPAVTLVQGLAKGDKLDTVLRQATEVGVAGFILAPFKRSVMQMHEEKIQKKQTRWESVVKSAAIQSGRTSLPPVSYCPDFSSLCKTLREFDCLLICYEECASEYSLRRVLSRLYPAGLPSEFSCAMVVGPEGGIAPEEITALLSANDSARMVTLGPTILRTETAGVVAPALALYELGQMSHCETL